MVHEYTFGKLTKYTWPCKTFYQESIRFSCHFQETVPVYPPQHLWDSG